MNDTQRFFCMIYTAYTLIAFSIFWQVVEKIIYGVIQPRVVDDIVALPLTLIIYLMWKFKTERDNHRKRLCRY